jgi:hypothetical protein
MTFDALTIAGILSAALSGVFVLATAAIQAPQSVHRRSTSVAPVAHVRSHLRRPAFSVLRRAVHERFRPYRPAATNA